MFNQLFSLSRIAFVLDTETTGVDVSKDRIIELAFQQWGSEGLVKEWTTRINPGISIPLGASKVHGIFDADIADRITFKQLAPNLAKGLSDCDFFGKNIRFDLRIIAAEMRRAGVEWSYAGARIVDIDRLEQLAEPRDLGRMHAKYVKVFCDECDGNGRYLDAPANVLDGHPYEVTCPACDGTGRIGKPHDGAHGALSDVQASTRVIVGQLEAHDSLPRDLDLLHARQWPGWIDPDGKFRFVEGVPCFTNWGKHANRPMKDADAGYWDFVLKSDFSPEVKKLASAAKIKKFPEASK